MPKPQGTYLRVQATGRNAIVASQAKGTVALAKGRERERFFDALHRISEGRLKSWHRSMRDLAVAIKKGDPLSKEDKVRKAVADILGEVKKVLVQVKDFKALEATLQQPAEMVIRAPKPTGTAGAELALVIALVQVLGLLVRWRSEKKPVQGA